MADGQILIDTRIDTKGIHEGSEDIEKELKDAADAASDAGKKIGGLSDSFKSVFGANIAAELLSRFVDTLKESVSQSIEAAAEIKAANAQFAQTFQEVETIARSSLQSIAKETGIAATRIQGSYTKIFAFTKSIGADTETALTISARAMQAAADSAAYYDVSVEEATETLQSFLKGNYENDAALGIAATETTRNAKANELYAKSFAKLSESQKVDVLLSMVEAGNEASGALGQAARESDAWANVTGELSEAWRQFLGMMGAPLIAVLTPVVQGITWLLNDLVSLGNEINRIFSDETPAQNLSEVALAAEATAINVQQLQLEYDAAMDSARQSIDAQIGLFDELSIKSETSASKIIKNWQSQQKAFTSYSDNLKKAVDIGLDEALVQQLSNGSAESMAILDALVNDTDVNVDEINSAFQKVEESRDTVSAVMADVQTDMSNRLQEMKSDIEDQFGGASIVVGDKIAEMQNYIDGLTGKEVYIDIYERYHGGGGGTSGPTLAPTSYEPAAYTPSVASITPQIPYLATGAVIPPRAPFMAVLGDQRNGTNIEAPLDTIKQAVSDVIGEGAIEVHNYLHFDGDLAQLGRMLKPVIDSEARRKGGSLAKGAVT